MKIVFSLDWQDKRFKFKDAQSLVEEYIKRASRFGDIGIEILSAKNLNKSGRQIWVCDRSAKALSSEELASKIDKLMSSGVKELMIVIGGADGFKKTDAVMGQANFVWSFGPMTLPHELALVVASEQLYRALTIIKGHPYHGGH